MHEKKKYIASVSFGKDSLAMLLKLIENKAPLDEVVFYDTGMEFDAIYINREKIKVYLQSKGIKFTELKPKQPFLYMMFDKKVKDRNKEGHHYGYSWCGGMCRWGTSEKTNTLNKYCQDNFVYVGIASNEKRRILKKRNSNIILPLVEWGITENECLKYCLDNGWKWLEKNQYGDEIELYRILDRVSCWCCANKNLKELWNYYIYLPHIWKRLEGLQDRTIRPFKNNKYTVYELGKRFDNGLKIGR